MAWGLAGAFASAFVYGAAVILQAVAARRAHTATELDLGLFWRLVRSWRYDLALVFEGVGFLLSLAAIRTLPLFVVQAVVSSSLAWTAVLATLFLGVHLRVREWAAVGVVCGGLVLLAASAGAQAPSRVDYLGRALLLVAVGAVALIGAGVARATIGRGTAAAYALGLVAGLGFSASGIAARVLPTPAGLADVFTEPAVYALVLGGVLGLLLSAQAYQRGSVTVTTAAVTAVGTLVPSGIGVLLLGDHARAGETNLSAAGFGLTLAGALLLARLGEAPVVEEPGG